MDDPNDSNLIDLNDLVEKTSQWQKQIYSIYRDNIQLLQDIDSFKKELKELKEADKLKDLEIQDCNGRVSELHGILSKRVALEDENRKLRKNVADTKDVMKEMEKSHQLLLQEAHKEIEEVRETLKVQIEEAKEEVTQVADAEKAALEETIAEKTSLVEKQQQQLRQAEKDKQTEIMRIRFEYDTKMLKLQKENARKQQTPQSSNINQDIFRKKLQHVKAESERETASLKRTITELQQKLNEKNQPQPGPAPGHMIKRIRRC